MELYYAMNRIYGENEKGETIAEITFPQMDEHTVNINHIFVDDSLRGQGIAGKLVIAAVESLRRTGTKAVVTCTYTQNWLQNHPEYTDILR